MLRKCLSIFLLYFVSSTAYGIVELPEELANFREGFPEAPIVQCPRGLQKYQDMLEQMEELKRKIRSEACPQSQLEAIQSDVASLETLITSGRDEFLDLVVSGLGQNQQLTAEEVASVQNYIDQVVKKVASITGLVNNPACFDEGERVSTLSFLSSLVGEASSVLGALSGPYGATISLGGQLAASLIGSLDQVVQARQTYDYQDREDRNNYLQNLCAYYEFKSDLDKETKVLTYSDRLWDLQDAVNEVLARLSAQCPECREVIADFSARVDRNQVFLVADAGLDGSLAASGMTTLQPRLTEDMTLRDLYSYYFQDGTSLTSDLVSGDFREIQTAETLLVPAMRLMTLRALQAQAWLEQEQQALLDSDSEALSDDGRREVMRVQGEIEDFLVDREGPRYIRYYKDTLRQALRNLNTEANRVITRLSMMQLEQDPNFDYRNKDFVATLVFHDLYRGNWEFRPVWGGELNPTMVVDGPRMIMEMRQPMIDALESVRVDYGILVSRCEFFAKSALGDRGPVRAACAQAESQMNQGKALLTELLQTSFARRHGAYLTFVSQEPANYTQDWLASLTAVLVMDLAYL